MAMVQSVDAAPVPSLNVVNLVRDTIELTVIAIGRLQADVVLGICPVDADVGHVLAVCEMVHVSPPNVIP
jgi:hypothetical protein